MFLHHFIRENYKILAFKPNYLKVQYGFSVTNCDMEDVSFYLFRGGHFLFYS